MGTIIDFSAYSTVKRADRSLSLRVNWQDYTARAYEWCEWLIQECVSGKPITMSFDKLTEHGDYNKDEGLFLSPDGNKLIFRIYNPETKRGIYRYISNVDELRAKQPELFNDYLKAGVYSFIERNYPYLLNTRRRENNYGKAEEESGKSLPFSNCRSSCNSTIRTTQPPGRSL